MIGKKHRWKIASMKKNNVGELFGLPLGCKTIGNKWLLKVKRKRMVKWRNTKCDWWQKGLHKLKESAMMKYKAQGPPK